MRIYQKLSSSMVNLPSWLVLVRWHPKILPEWFIFSSYWLLFRWVDLVDSSPLTKIAGEVVEIISPFFTEHVFLHEWVAIMPSHHLLRFLQLKSSPRCRRSLSASRSPGHCGPSRSDLSLLSDCYSQLLIMSNDSTDEQWLLIGHDDSNPSGWVTINRCEALM